MKKEVKVGTHNGEFHADEVFALAILKKIYPDLKITRTRNDEKLKTMDFRIDVGRKYNPRTNDFDHHQIDFKLKRKNGIPYASAGLIWKHFGKKITNSKESFDYIEEKLIQQIDAHDNGMEISENKIINPYTISEVVGSFNRTWNENQDQISEDAAFNDALGTASKILEREITKANSLKEGEKIVLKAIKKNQDFIVLDKKKLPYTTALIDKPNIKFVIFPENETNWISLAIAIKKGDFKRRALFPSEWAGSEKDLEQKTGIRGAAFCHKHRFITAATTKEGAIELTKLALQKIKNETN